jgi:GT2 family glycosyltransferase
MDVSVCTPVYRAHGEPNVATLAASMDRALDSLAGELIVALNGISGANAGVPLTARTVDLGVNRGVSPGWNAAAGIASGAVLVFANDDVVLGDDALRVMYDSLMSRPEAGVVGPVGTFWDLVAPAHTGRVDLTGHPPGDVVPCDVISGFLFAMRREVWEALGGFDEAYAPCSMEEVDLCTDVRLRLGLNCYAVAGLGYEHDYGISVSRPWTRIEHNGRKEFLRSIHVRNLRRFRGKWRGRVAAGGSPRGSAT